MESSLRFSVSSVLMSAFCPGPPVFTLFSPGVSFLCPQVLYLQASSGRAVPSTRCCAELVKNEQLRNGHKNRTAQNVIARTTTGMEQVYSKFWEWTGYGNVHYLYKEVVDVDKDDDAVNILFLPGFGSPAELFRSVMGLPVHGRVFAMDMLGQGLSEPQEGTESMIDVEMWKKQIISFVEEVIVGRVYLAGNSLGGLLTAAVAAEQDVTGCILMNPTPFWSVVPHPKVSPFMHEVVRPWLGFIKRNLLERFWKNLTREETVEATLKLIYAREDKVTSDLISAILEPTRRSYAESVFMSLLLSPGLENSFDESVKEAFVRRGVPLCLIQGRDDPWVGPLWGMRIKQRVKNCVYYEFSPSGHCPHSECDAATKATIASWISAVEGGHDPCGWNVQSEEPIDGVRIERKDGVPRNVLEQVACGDSFELAFVAATVATLLSFPEIGSLPAP